MLPPGHESAILVVQRRRGHIIRVIYSYFTRKRGRTSDVRRTHRRPTADDSKCAPRWRRTGGGETVWRYNRLDSLVISLVGRSASGGSVVQARRLHARYARCEWHAGPP